MGAGVGGLATAVRLLSKGYSVKVYEKEQNIGGKVNQIETDNFKFDLTASILMTPEVYKEVFEYADKDYRDYLEFLSVDPIYRVNYSDGTRRDFSTDITKLSENLESISIDDCHGYLRFLGDVYKKYQIANNFFLQRTFRTPLDFFNPKILSQALRLRTLSNSYRFISKYIEDENLRKFLCFQSLYVGISPYNGPNIYTLVPTISQIYGLWYLKGGMYSYIKALERLIFELGGTIENNTNVEEILISEGKAIGVKTNTNKQYGDIIICNADFPYAMNELIKDNRWKGKYSSKKISEMKYSCSTFIIYLGLKKKYPDLTVHNMYLG
ncbi:phytoene desaturase family protein [Anaeromonas frigoriresistens]|uniref:phytoene desaturase family protein n=1 Tax=Anaeromonas frigoriresistens TaxID=2683708 RepID=UPI0033158B2B